MTWANETKWFGIAIISSIILSVCAGMISAIRAGRFGFKYVEPKGLVGSVIALTMGVLFFYGWFRYPDGPLHSCDGPMGYCGKQGQPHTLPEYQAFVVWQASLFVVWPAGMLALFLLNRKSGSAVRR